MVRILKEHGVAHALVNLGGNIMVVNGRKTGLPGESNSKSEAGGLR